MRRFYSYNLHRHFSFAKPGMARHGTVRPFHLFSRFRAMPRARAQLGLALCLFTGIMMGGWLASACAGGAGENFINYYTAALLRTRCSDAFWQVFASSMFSSLLFLALLLLFAFSCFGAPCVAGLLLLEGGVFGAMNAALYTQLGSKGLFVSAVLFLGPECIRFIFFVLTARHAMQTSTTLFAAQFLAKDVCVKAGTGMLRMYMSASVACIVAALMSGALCSVFCPVFFP